mmetsp:Transcript_14128/g.33625  ORF Transcript_14128/g.33625 Transcript_14128/m.33625 type:complete len:87 (+) Transcript_14128:389-649(+)
MNQSGGVSSRVGGAYNLCLAAENTVWPLNTHLLLSLAVSFARFFPPLFVLVSQLSEKFPVLPSLVSSLPVLPRPSALCGFDCCCLM